MSITTFQSPNQSSLIEIDSVGASIARLKLKDTEIIWSGTRPDGGKGITHPCIPNFNIADKLPNHGPARKEEWQKVSENTYAWKMAAIDDVYPAGLEVTRQFALSDDTLTVTTTIVNHSDQDLPINIAEHNYFRCKPELRDQVKVNGVLFDKGGLEANAKFLPIGGNELRIEIPGTPLITMTVDGYTAFAQWSQPDAPFVCIEPIQTMPMEPSEFMSKTPRIGGRKTIAFEYVLRVP